MWRARTLATAALAVVLLGSAPARAAGASVDTATREQSRAAQKTFEAGDLLYDDKRYAEALGAFRASYDVVASPNTRLMIARSLRELNRLGEAIAEFEGAVAVAEAAAKSNERYTETANAARQELEALRAKVGMLSVRVRGAASGATV